MLQQHSNQNNYRIVGHIYTLGVVMLMIQIILGGITRLTGSGLSITKWDVITGILPPLSVADWHTEFSYYQSTPQYQLLNTHFTLSDFKFIFFWEWIHRFWARLIALVLIACIWYLKKKKLLSRKLLKDFLFLAFLGVLQGVVGWLMVNSGLAGDALYVQPSKLAVHFIFAMFLIGTVWVYAIRQYTSQSIFVQFPGVSRLCNWSYVVAFFLLAQLAFGAFIAGSKAVAVASTWPTINGSWFPESLFDFKKGNSWIENGIFLHFVHRMLAYLLVVLIAFWVWMSRVSIIYIPMMRKLFWVPIILVLVQVGLGVGSVLSSTKIIPNEWGRFAWMAQLHQVVAMLLVLYVVTVSFLFLRSKYSSIR